MKRGISEENVGGKATESEQLQPKQLLQREKQKEKKNQVMDA